MAKVLKANERLREKNDALRGEVEELKEMAEIPNTRGRPGSSSEVAKLEDEVDQ